MRVYLAAFGSGMGHASRMSVLAERLRSLGDEVAFSSSGEVANWLRSRGYLCNEIPLVDVEFTGAGAFSATQTLKFLPRTLKRFFRQLERETSNLGAFRPDVVLSDSVASTVIASRLRGVRTVAVLNQIRLNSSPRTPRPIAKSLSAASVAIGGAFWNRCDDVLIPDLPPPYTISESNLWNAGKISARARYIGFLTPVRTGRPGGNGVPESWRTEKRRRKVFWQISGPPATRKTLLARALEAAKSLADEYLFVITAGSPGGSRAPVTTQGGLLYEWCDSTAEFVDSCDIVVSRAGHVSVSDYILRAKPAVLIPIPAQTEQMGNALKAEKLGVAVSLAESALDGRTLGDALRRVSTRRYAERALEMQKVAEEYDALSSIVDLLKATSASS